MRTNLFLLLACFIMIGLSSCLKEGAELQYNYYIEDDYSILKRSLNLPSIPYDYSFDQPTFISGNSKIIKNNGLATLGRVLFYDKNLSSDKTVSCASCHKQERAFSDDAAFSKGAENKVTARNSLALGSVATFEASYNGESFATNKNPFFWDNRAASIQDQSKETLANPLEMNMHMDQILERVNKLDYYQAIANKETGTKILTSDIVLNAIAEFVNAIPNVDSKFDKELSKVATSPKDKNNVFTPFSGFTQQENEGKTIYLNKCASCHGQDFVVAGLDQANNGLAKEYKDQGIGARTKNQSDIGLFKVPTLRNIALTAPYMHDGSIATLERVIDHYSNGIVDHQNLDSKLKVNGKAVKMNFTPTEKESLLAFLNTVTAINSIKDVKYSDPFLK